MRTSTVPATGSRGPALADRTPWDGVLLAGFVALVVGGAALWATPDLPALAWLNGAVRRAFFGSSPTPEGAESLRRWLYAVEGSTLMAFGLLGMAVARTAFRRRERWARNALVLAVAAWYPLDTAASLAAGVWENAVLNTAIAVVLLLPVAVTWRRFVGPAGDRDSVDGGGAG
jgi:hypothetical protein